MKRRQEQEYVRKQLEKIRKKDTAEVEKLKKEKTSGGMKDLARAVEEEKKRAELERVLLHLLTDIRKS